jgi:hypothetical protein
MLILAVGILATCLALAAIAHAQFPTPGGTVPSTLAVSLDEPTPFRRIGRSDFFTATIRARVTATDVPTRLSLIDGAVTAGRRLGHMAGGNSILSPALEVTVGPGPGAFRSLDTAPPRPLKTWNRPLSGEEAKIRLRQKAPHARALRNHGKLLLVTLTAGGP